MDTVVVVGASLAGHAMAQSLRREGFDGRLVVLGEEVHRPYDRPPLSKQFLTGRLEPGALALEDPEEDLDVEWRLGSRAIDLDVDRRTVRLADGRTINADAVVVATGSRARSLPGVAPRLRGVHYLRTLDDALTLRQELVPGARLVVLGAGFIGSEVAATAAGMGLSVTVVEAALTPLAGPLGAQAGATVSSLHARHGVRVLCGTPVTGLVGGRRLQGVALADGRTLEADLVLVAIGSVPNTEWLAGSGLEASLGLRCDSRGRAAAGIFGVGDCSAWFDPSLGQNLRIEHWTDSMQRAGIVAASMLRPEEETKPLAAPYFWSDQYDVRIQYAGRRTGDEIFRLEHGSAEEEKLLGVYWRGQDPMAVLALNQPREFGRWRRRLVAPIAQPVLEPTKRKVEA